MASGNNNVLILFVIVVVVAVVTVTVTFDPFGAGGSDDIGGENTTVGDQLPDDNPEKLDNSDEVPKDESSNKDDPDDSSDQTSDDGGDDSHRQNSLAINVKTVTGESIERGNLTIYSSASGEHRVQVEEYNLSQGLTHTFSNLTQGDQYTVEVEPELFPAKNFTIEAGQTEQFTAELGYELRGAETYTTNYEVRSLGIAEDGTVYSDVVYVGETTVDPEGDYYTTYIPKSDQGDPTVDHFDSLYIAEVNTSYRNLQGTSSKWRKTDSNFGPVATSDQLVQTGLINHNRTFIEEVQRGGETRHRYNTDIGIVEVNPDTGYVTYFDKDVSDDEEQVYVEVWFHSHNSDDLEAIPEDFEPPSSGNE